MDVFVARLLMVKVRNSFTQVALGGLSFTSLQMYTSCKANSIICLFEVVPILRDNDERGPFKPTMKEPFSIKCTLRLSSSHRFRRGPPRDVINYS